MKFTKSQDGKLRCNVTVDYRVGRAELFTAVAYRISMQVQMEEIDDENKVKSRTEAMQLFKDTVRFRGLDCIYNWRDHWNADACVRIQQFTDTEIDRLFPELKDSK